MLDKKDIQTEEDIKVLVNSFYEKVNSHPDLSFFFNEFSKVSWEHHLPKMYDFWSSILFGSMKYSGQPFPKHMVLPLQKENFEQWLVLFFETVEEHFSGPTAEEAKMRAAIIARTFMYKMGLAGETKN